MSPPSARPTTEALLAHVEWVRRLARLLVANEHDAADVEQETWRQALERPPKHAGALRQWLAAVVRNVARKSVRAQTSRERREHDVAATAAANVSASTSAATSPAHDVTARAELHRRVVDAVLTLEEIYRAPLLLRFFDDLSAVEVARRLEVPVETARTRIKRGLALLRARLGSEFGGDGREGIAALAPLLWVGGKAPVAVATVSAVGGGASTIVGGGIVGMVVGGAFMSKFAKVAVGVVVAALACFGSYKVWLEPRPEGDRARPSANRPPDLPLPAIAPALPKAAPAAAATREAVERAAPEKPTTPVSLATIDGIVLDAAARPIAGATVVLDRRTGRWMESLFAFRSAHRSFKPSDSKDVTFRLATSAADGSFHFDEVDPKNQWALGAIHDPLGTGWTDQVAFAGSPANARVVISLEAGVVVFGTVRDPAGQPIFGAVISFDGAADKPSDTNFRFGGQLCDTVASGEDGSFRSLSLPWRFARMHVLAQGRPDLAQLQTKYEELPHGENEFRHDLTMEPLTVLRGRILGPDGRPARLARTVVPKLGADAMRVQSRGTIAVAAFAEDPRGKPDLIATLGTNTPGLVYLDSDHLYGTLALDEDRYEVPLRSSLLRFIAVIARDQLLGVAEIPTPPTAPDLVIDPSLVPDRSLLHTLRLHFRDGRDESPLAGVDVFATAITVAPDGQMGMEVLNFGVGEKHLPDQELQLPRMPCSIVMNHPGFVRRSVSIDASHGGAPTELTFDFLPAGGPLVVTVVDEGDKAIAGASMRFYRVPDHEFVHVGGATPTDEHGESKVTGIPTGELLVVVQKHGFAPAVETASIGEDGENHVDLVLEKGYEITVNAHGTDGAAARAGQLSISNDAGAPLYDSFELLSGGPTRLSNAKFRLTDGTYTVRCLIPGGEGGSTKFVAAPGAIVDVALAPIR